MYADDCSLFLPVSSNDSSNASTIKIQNDLNRLASWSNRWKLFFKADKSKEVIFHSPRKVHANFQELYLDHAAIPRGPSHKHLGVILDNRLNFEEHLTHISVKCNSMLNPLKSLKRRVQSKHLEKMYLSFILPHLEYGSIIFDLAPQNKLAMLDRIHYHAALTVSGCMVGTSETKVLKCIGWLSLAVRRKEKKLLLMHDLENNRLPVFIVPSFYQYLNPVHDVRLRNHRKFALPRGCSQRFYNSTIPNSIKQWESIPQNIKVLYSRNSFKYNIRIFLGGTKNKLSTTKLDLPRQMEITLNQIRNDRLLKAHLYAHNYTNVPDPSCACGNTFQSTKHLFFHCPITHELREVFLNDLLLLPAFRLSYRTCNTIDDRLQVFLYGHADLPYNVNKIIIEKTSLFLVESLKELGLS